MGLLILIIYEVGGKPLTKHMPKVRLLTDNPPSYEENPVVDTMLTYAATHHNHVPELEVNKQIPEALLPIFLQCFGSVASYNNERVLRVQLAPMTALT